MTGRRRRRTTIDQQFIAYTVPMLQSPAFRLLSLSARRLLNRIELEHAHHGGMDNGKLPVTYDDFVAYGIHRHSVAPAIRECEALGFIEITERGHAGNADFRSCHKFRLTYIYAGPTPTNEWQRIKTDEEAATIAKAARAPIKRPRKNRKPVPVNANFSGGNRHRKRKFHSSESITTAMVQNPSLHSISRGGGRAA